MRTLIGFSLLVVLAATAATAPEDAAAPGPEEAWQDLQKALGEARQARDRAKIRSLPLATATEFLAKWEAGGGKAEGDARHFLGLFYGAANRHLEAFEAFKACAGDESLREELRPRAVANLSRSLVRAINDGKMTGETATEAVKHVEGQRGMLKAPSAAAMLSTFHRNLAYANDRLGNSEPAIEHHLAAADADSAAAYSAARGALGILTAHAVAMEDYPKIRERGEHIVKVLTERYAAYVEGLKESGNTRALGRAESTLRRLANLARPLEMLGKPAEEWTLLQGWGETKAIADHRGKVVMLDFWATWCGWCIRSFPALRDLTRDYADKDLVLVGVTAHAGNVYPSNYALDDDLKAKATGGRPTPLRLPRDATEEQRTEFRAKALEMIGTFIDNHELTWDIVLIDEKEPSAKYALTGWPHAVVLDRQGRIRHFKSGALLRDQPGQVAKFRKILDTLLREE